MRKFGKLSNPIRAFLIALIVSIGIKIYFKQKDAIKEPKYKVEKGLEGYLKSFVNLADLNGIDLSYIYGQNITIVWEVVINKNSTNVATAFGRDKDEIIIVVNKERFMARTDEGRKYVMFHELGHDILNFPHLEHPERGMMEPTAYTGFFKSYERFSQERQEKYLYTSLKGMFDRFKGDGIADDSAYIKDGTYIEIGWIGQDYIFQPKSLVRATQLIVKGNKVEFRFPSGTSYIFTQVKHKSGRTTFWNEETSSLFFFDGKYLTWGTLNATYIYKKVN